MIFELTNENVRSAIQDYCTKMGITAPIENVQFKVARKGNKGTTALVTVAAKPTPPVQLELPFTELVDELILEEEKEKIKGYLSNLPENVSPDIQKVTEDIKEFIFSTTETERLKEPPEGKIYGLNADKPEPAPTTQSPFKKLF
jgi:hypothetical protein